MASEPTRPDSEPAASAEAAGERAALIHAFTRLAPQRGLERLDGEEVARQAGLHPGRFHAHFPSMRHCLLAAHDSYFERLAHHVAADCAGIEGFSQRVSAALASGLEFLDETSSRARFFVVEAFAAGPALLERRYAQTARLAALLREGRRHHRAAAALPEAAEWVVVAGALARIGSHLLAEQGALLPSLRPELVELLLVPYLGPERARRIAADPDPEADPAPA